MTVDDMIRDEKLIYDIDREAAKISVLSSDKIDKSEYLISGVILLSDQRSVIQEPNFTYSRSEKAAEKQAKWIGDQGENKYRHLKGMENN